MFRSYFFNDRNQSSENLGRESQRNCIPTSEIILAKKFVSFLKRVSLFPEEKLTLCTHLSQKLSKKSFISWMLFFSLCLKCENCVLIERIRMYIWRYREAKISWTKLFRLGKESRFLQKFPRPHTSEVFLAEVVIQCFTVKFAVNALGCRMSRNVNGISLLFFFFPPWCNVHLLLYIFTGALLKIVSMNTNWFILRRNWVTSLH